MKAPEKITPEDNILDLLKNQSECVKGIRECQRIIEYIESQRYISECELVHLNLNKQALYKFEAFKATIDSHLRKFLS